MNERIKDLMRQADYPAPEIALRAQKLAELIVQECVQVCGSVDEANVQFRYDYRRGALDCADAIRQHFGVE